MLDIGVGAGTLALMSEAGIGQSARAGLLSAADPPPIALAVHGIDAEDFEPWRATLRAGGGGDA